MNTIMKTALGAIMLGGAALAGHGARQCCGVVGVTVGVPGVAVGDHYGESPATARWPGRPAILLRGRVWCSEFIDGAGWYAPDRVHGGRDVVVREGLRPATGGLWRDRDDFRDRDAGVARDVR